MRRGGPGAGLVRAGLVVLDGAKLRANASRKRNRTQAQLEAEIERMLGEAERVDAEEQARGCAERGDALPPALLGREQRLAANPDAKVNLSDPDSRVVRECEGHVQGYNAQALATREQVVVAAELTRAATDVHELLPMLEAASRNLQALDQAPVGVLLADAGYFSDANVTALAETGPELLIASRSDGNRRAAGPAPRGRIPDGLSLRERMRRTLTTKRGRRLYEQRRWMIEPVFGDIKENRRIRRFQRRGFDACASE